MVVIQHADDVLVVGRCQEQVRLQTMNTKMDLEQAGWVVSPKSKLEPQLTTQWMGKVVGGQKGGVENAPSLQAHLVCCWLWLATLRLATTSYSAKSLRQMLGKLQWAVRLGRGSNRDQGLCSYPMLTLCGTPPPVQPLYLIVPTGSGVWTVSASNRALVCNASNSMSSGEEYVIQRDGTSAGLSSPFTQSNPTTTPEQRSAVCAVAGAVACSVPRTQ